VILSLPVGIFGSFLFLRVMGLANDIYAQIGLIMLVGLLGKNAILIVEFAVQRRREGRPLHEAAVEGGKLRFRPIQMTSFAFIAGLIPLVFATGAGAIGNRTIGTTGAGGMLVGTVIGVLVIPGLYYLFGKIADGRKLLRDEVDEPLSELLEHDRLPPDDSAGEDAVRPPAAVEVLPESIKRDRLPAAGSAREGIGSTPVAETAPPEPASNGESRPAPPEAAPPGEPGSDR
jgi:HAE1 family hydrophobic/amphiphilic exporter-1